MDNGQQVYQAKLPMEQRPRQEGNTTTDLWGIVQSYRDGHLLKPPHQRDRVWSEETKMGWIDRLRGERLPIGAIITYQIVDNGQVSAVYINDGFQRVSTTLEYLDNPERFQDTVDQAMMYVKACSSMPLQHRHYKSHEEALVDFQQVNLGTALTPYEFYKGILTYMERYPQFEESLTHLHELIPLNERRITTARSKRSRSTSHKLYRSDYGLLLRFLDADSATKDYKTASDRIRYDEVINRASIEWQLRQKIETMQPAEFAKAIDLFGRLIESETAEMETIWYQELAHLPGEAISVTLYRFLLDTAIVRRHRNIAREVWRDFVTKLFELTNGRSLVTLQDHKHYTLTLNRMSLLKGVCKAIESDFYYQVVAPERRSNGRLRTIAGYDKSHLLPFSTNGDGAVFPEAAGRNRARGARPV